MRPKTTIKIVKSGRACRNSEMEKGKPLGFETNVQSDQVARNWLEMATTDKTLTVILLTEKC